MTTTTGQHIVLLVRYGVLPRWRTGSRTLGPALCVDEKVRADQTAQECPSSAAVAASFSPRSTRGSPRSRLIQSRGPWSGAGLFVANC